MMAIMVPHGETMVLLTDNWSAPDGHFYYSPEELYSHLANWSEAGRTHYINFRLGPDPVWALAYTAFLITITSVALRYTSEAHDHRRLLNLFPLIPMLLDISENFMGIALVSAYPRQLPLLAVITAVTTTSKWLTLAVAHLIMIYALLKALRLRIRQ